MIPWDHFSTTARFHNNLLDNDTVTIKSTPGDLIGCVHAVLDPQSVLILRGLLYVCYENAL